MESNNILAAPQVVGTETIYVRWRRGHVGSRKDFYEFMTTPAAARDSFLAELEAAPVFSGAVAAITLTA